MLQKITTWLVSVAKTNLKNKKTPVVHVGPSSDGHMVTHNRGRRCDRNYSVESI